MLFSEILRHYLIKGNLKWRKASAQDFWSERHRDFDDDFWVNLYHNDRSYHRMIIGELVNLLNPSSIFEFGCSAAPNYSVISDLGFNGCYYGVDINQEAINFSKKRYGKDNVQFRLSTPNSIDSILSEVRNDLFLSVYSLAYIEYHECVELLSKFKHTKIFIIAEPISNFKKSIYLNRIPELAHNYDSIFENHIVGNFSLFRYNLPERKNKLSSISLYIRRDI